MTTLNLLKRTTILNGLLLMFTFALTAQDPIGTNNNLITGVSVDYFFDEENNGTTKLNFATNIIDNDVSTVWAGNLGNNNDNSNLIFNLNGKYDLAEIQYLTIAKEYLFKIFISTTDTNDYTSATYTEYFTDEQDENGYLLSNTDEEFMTFVFDNPVQDATFVKIECFGRYDSDWNTISELGFYQEGAVASVEENELQLSSLYPVPANNKLLLNNFDNKVQSIAVYSLQGKRIMNLTTNFSDKVEINTSSLVNGVYLVKLSNVNNVSIGKLITVQH